ncbi:hypothetical protein [Brevundimonas basaltis]|uniref:CPBP family intramembrane metalloprotease n=2 Tax=Brevundimonas basaltis TaxID=472166 RepID=A0A7W8MGT9_9CAUL|nr:hypothetical protein [Brevundimonas basaltis]
MKAWPLRRVWVSSTLVGGLCVVVMLCMKVGLFVALPEVTPAFRAGETTAPENKALLTLFRELVISAALIPFIETLLVFYLPGLALHRVRGRVGAVAFVGFTGAVGWAFHGADIHALAHGLCFALLGAWFWTVMVAQGRGRAVLATTLAHGTWNGLLLLLWFVWGGT